MAHAQSYEHDITCIDTEQQRRGLAACYLVGHGGRYGFIDTGTSLSLPALLAVLQARGIDRAQVDYVMPTHVHLDHAGGAGALMQALPNARLVIHPRGARHLIDPSRLIDGAVAVYGADAVRRMYGDIVPVPEARVIVADVEDGKTFELDLGGRRLEFIDAPGHARHHYVIWDALSCGWFTGDTFGISYREFDWNGCHFLIPTTTPVQFEPDAWRQTLAQLMARQPRWMYLTHYGRVGDTERLAEDLRRGLDVYTRLADGDAGADHDALMAALTRHHLDELSLLDHPMAEIRARELLAFDMDLNAQGLQVWRARRRKAATA